MKQSLVGYVCVCVFFEGGGALHPLMNMFIFGPKRNGILLLGASQCHVYGWRTGPFWCATFYLKVRRFPGELISPITLDFLWFAINFAHHHFTWIPDSTKWIEANVTYSYTETWLFMVMLILCSIGKKYTKVCSFLYFQFAKWVPPKSEFSRRLSKTCHNTGAVGNRFEKIAPLKRSKEKMPTGHMFASKKYLDLDPEQFWTRFWMVPLKSTEYWWLSSLWGTWNVPMIFFQWSHNNGAPVEMTWFSTQENA